jgi:hypothetical protein
MWVLLEIQILEMRDNQAHQEVLAALGHHL